MSLMAKKSKTKIEEISMFKEKSRDITRQIKRIILQAETDVKAKYPILHHQNGLGLFFFLSSIVLLFTISWGYLYKELHWLYTIVLMALPISILHELEHDLIHNLYFKTSKFVQDIMFSFIWFFKFHGNPWWRRDIHHWHHRVSGQSNDIEERLIGLGMKPGWRRLGLTTHPLGFTPELKTIKTEAGDCFDVKYMNTRSMPTALVLVFFIKLYPVLLLSKLLLSYSNNNNIWEASGLSILFPFVNDFMILLTFPLILRQSCLVAMSTACHYYGDIPKNNVFFQNQILDSWWLFPLQFFCCNFGKNHILHHYIPQQPFYMRFLIQQTVCQEMQEFGVRKNDWGIIRRANRWERKLNEKESTKDKLTALWWFASVVLFSFISCFVWDYQSSTVSLRVVFLYFTYPIYSRTKAYQEKMAERKPDKGVPKITNLHA